MELKNLTDKGRCFSFTWNNPGKEASSFLEDLGNSDGIFELIYQYQKGKTRGVFHFQGMIYFNNPRHLSAVIKLLKGCHIEIAKKPVALRQYVSKSETRIEGPFHFKNGRPFMNLSLKKDSYKNLYLKENQLFNWQRQLYNIFLSHPDDRTIIWIYDKKGNNGKSAFCRFLRYYHSNNVFCTSGNPADIKHGLKERITKYGSNSVRAVIWDISRSSRSFSSMTAEDIKNGSFYSTKYESEAVELLPPHIFIFSNKYPEKTLFSQDRWKIGIIENNSLFWE